MHHRMSIPLVWRYTWIEEEKRVLIQFKMDMKNKGNRGKSEWDPWITKTEMRNHPTTGLLEEVQVHRHSVCNSMQ